MIRLRSLCLLTAITGVAQAANFSVTVNGTASHAIPETMWGIMYEDISGGDGGLYAELLQNRAFQQVTPGTLASLNAWTAVNGAQIAVVNSTTPLSSALPNSLQVQIPSNSSGPVGVANSGYFGIKIDKSWTYNASVNFKFAEGSDFIGTLTASLVGLDGTVFASASQNVSGSNATNWTEFFVTLKPNASAPNTNNTFNITVDGESAAGETVFFSLFSLFPPTFKNRPNGMRIDLAEALADLKPAFLRFPGGNNLGDTIAGRWIWNNTVGPLSSRPGHLGVWGYINTDGLGLKECLDFIEDLGMQPIMAVWSGYSFGETAAEADLAQYIQEAIDQINFVIGDPGQSEAGTYDHNSAIAQVRWHPIAALRASLGHPEPYTLNYVEIGNEDFFESNTYASYRWRDIVGNLSTAFPDLHFIATTVPWDPVLTPTPDYYDVHFYETPTTFYQNAFYYDDFQRNGTLYFEAREYAAISINESDPTGTPIGRLIYPIQSGSTAEAAFQTGLERNADIVFAASYAVLLQNINNYQWTPDLISFDADGVIKSTSYYVQQLFSQFKGTEYLPSTLPTRGNPVHWSVVSDTSNSAIYIKVANAGAEEADVTFSLPFNVASQAELTVLVGGANDSNTPASPNTVTPQTLDFTASNEFVLTAAPYSVNVLNLTQA